MPALLFGSIGVLAETSHLQRDAFNDAFREAGLDWHWSEADYRAMLSDAGGRDRIARYADERGEQVNADALHARKTALFQARLEQGVPLRPGIEDAMAAARDKSWQIAFVTTTAPDNVAAILTATGVSPDDFALILNSEVVAASKPDPAPYILALAQLGVSALDCVAVEDNPDGLTAAKAAGISCIAFPGAYHDPDAFAGARVVTDRLSTDMIIPGS